MKFADPYYLNLLWALIPVFGIIAFGMHQRVKILNTFMKTDLFRFIAPGYAPKKRWVKHGFVLLAAGLCITALAGPQAGYRWEQVEQKGVDIMIALDCSRSMLAQDIKPSRLARAKREIIDLMRMMKSDRAGLVAFSGTAVLQCPLTLDREAFHIFLDVLKPGYLPVGGTDLQAAIETCAHGFEKQSDTQKAIILITDGENTTGDIERTAKEMAKQDIKVFCVGVGERQGAPIPDENGGFVKDASGNIVLSRVDEKGLKKIAKLTNAAFVRSVAGDMDLDVVYKHHILGGMEKSTLVSEKRKIWENRFQWLLLPAVLLLVVEMMLSGSKRCASKCLVFLICLFWGLSAGVPGNVQATTVSKSVKQGIEAFEKKDYPGAKKHFIDAQLKDPENKALYYDIGTAAYMNNEFELARQNFSRAAGSNDPALRHNALYNLANTEYRMGNLDKAIENYKALLKEYPKDRQARENLDFVRKKKKQEEQQKKTGKKQGNKNQNPDKKDQDDKNPENRSPQDKNQENTDGKKPSPKKREPGKSGKSEKLEKSGKSGKPDKPNQNKGASSDKAKGSRNQSDDQPEKANQAPQPKSDSENSRQADSGRTGVENQKTGPDKRQVEQMLNRLSDKPGQALMPLTGHREIEKDW